MSDREFFCALVCACVMSFGLAYLMARYRRRWSDHRVVLISALPLPGLLMALMAFMIGHAHYTSLVDPEACGVDACGMGISIGFMGFGAGMAAYAIALLPALLGVRLAR